jgi:N-acetylmuramoyl-L-alanine amidase
VAIEAGHGGPYWFGASGRGADGELMLEKDLNLDMATRLDALLDAAGYNSILIRDGDYTIMPFNSWDYRSSLAAETQARVDVANSLKADILVSLHFNGSSDASISGTQTYYNPDRSFGPESYGLAFFVHDALVRALGETEYDVRDLGIRNDAEVGGDPNNAHSFLLGTNAKFRPSLMPGIISEPLFLSNSGDVAAIADEEVRQRMATAYREGIDAYFGWLMTPR